jgi:hypothetical protein
MGGAMGGREEGVMGGREEGVMGGREEGKGKEGGGEPHMHTLIVHRLGEAGVNERHQVVIGAEYVYESGGQLSVVVLAHLSKGFNH